MKQSHTGWCLGLLALSRLRSSNRETLDVYVSKSYYCVSVREEVEGSSRNTVAHHT